MIIRSDDIQYPVLQQLSYPSRALAMAQQRAEALYDFNPTADVELKIKVSLGGYTMPGGALW